MDYLFWFVGDADLSQQLSLASRRYEERTGRKPTRVLLPKGQQTAGATGAICAEDAYVLPGHMMVGE
jgi:hypothetical protein